MTIPSDAIQSSPEEDLPLAPADGLSENERTFKSRFYPPVEEKTPERSSRQFSIRDLMLVTLFVAIGLGGGTVVPADRFAGFIGFVLAAGLFFRLFIPIENRWLNWTFGGIAVVYGCALLRMLVMSFASQAK
jgi:hypothetical protein